MPTINSLQKEIDSLKQRISVIEQRPYLKPPKPHYAKEEPKKDIPSFEAEIGLRWFSVIGILALVIGIGFFIKYAFDNNWVGYAVRIIIGIIIGISLIVAGEIISRTEKYLRWGKTLVGGGFAVTYFAVYSAYHFENCRIATGMSLGMDIVLLSIVVLLAILMSLKSNSQIIIGEAFFLGYITSLLSKEFEVLTLVYCLLLTIGLVIVVSYKKWSLIGIGGAVATYLIFILWHLDNKNKFWISTVFLITYFVAYTIQSFLLTSDNEADIITTLINSALFFILYYHLVRGFYPDYSGLFTIALSVFYLGAYLISQKPKLSTTHLYLTLLFLTLAIPIQLNDELVTVMWALETVILTILSFRLNMNILRNSSYVVGGITALKTFFVDALELQKFDWANILGSTRFFAYISAIVAFYIVAWYMENNKEVLRMDETFVPEVYTWAGIFFLTLLIMMEMQGLWISLGWTVLALAILVCGFNFKRKELRLQGIILFGITIFKVFLVDTSHLSTLHRTISFIVLGAILLLVSFVYTRYKDRLRGIL